MLNDILAHHTGKKTKQIEKDTDRDLFLDAEASMEYGLVDDILTKPPEDETKVE
jgi:ATP-dependent Clp protease protease subunit